MSVDVTFKDNSIKVKELSENAKKLALWAIGATAEGHAKNVITRHGRVDTGRMRNSVAFATFGKDGKTINYDSATDTESEETVKSDDKDAVYIGTNVDYAPYNELGTVNMSGIHFLQKAATNYSKEYRGIVKDAYENA